MGGGMVVTAGTPTAHIYPLRRAAPMVGVRPFIVEGAYRAADRIRCVVTSVRQRTSAAPAACEIFVITLRYDSSEPRDGTAAANTLPHPTVAVSHVHLLQVISLANLPNPFHLAEPLGLKA